MNTRGSFGSAREVKASLIFASLALLIVATGCPGPIKKIPYTDPTKTGGFLEPYFFALAGGDGGSSCKLGIPSVREKKSTAVPSSLWSVPSLGLDAAVTAFTDQSAQNLFLNVFPKPELPKDFAPTQMLPRDLVGSRAYPVPSPEGNESSVAYRFSCAGFLQAALEGELKVPSESIKAAIRAETEDHANIVVVAGSFRSPLAFLYKEGGPTTKLLASMELWEIYKNDPGLQKAAYYLDNFKGVAVFEVLSKNQRTDLNMNAGGSLSAPIGSVDFRMKAGLDQGSQLNVTQFATAVFKNQLLEKAFLKLPTPQEIATQLRSTATTATYGSSSKSDVLAQGSDYSNWVDVDGVPKRFCDPSLWSLDSTKLRFTNPRMLVQYQPSEADAPPRCRFGFSGTPKAEVFTTNSTGQESVEYVLKGPAIGTVALEVPVSRGIATTEQPALVSPAELTRFGTEPQGNGAVAMTWKTSFDYVDENSPINLARAVDLKVNKISGACQGVPKLFSVQRVGFAPVGQRIVLEFRSMEPHQLTPADAQAIECTAEAVLKLPVGPTSSVNRSVAIRIQYPQVDRADVATISPRYQGFK